VSQVGIDLDEVPGDGGPSDTEITNDGLEEGRSHVDVGGLAAATAVNNGGNDGAAGALSVNRDPASTDGVVVGVAINGSRVVETSGNSDDELSVLVEGSTGGVSNVDVVPGTVTRVTLSDSGSRDGGSRGDESNDGGSELHCG
jgi:hypothetical protein